MQVLDAQYNEKPSQLPNYVFSTVPSILPIQQPNLSPSELSTDLPIVTPNTTHSKDPTQPPSNKNSWFSSFFI